MKKLSILSIVLLIMLIGCGKDDTKKEIVNVSDFIESYNGIIPDMYEKLPSATNFPKVEDGSYDRYFFQYSLPNSGGVVDISIFTDKSSPKIRLISYTGATTAIGGEGMRYIINAVGVDSSEEVYKKLDIDADNYTKKQETNYTNSQDLRYNYVGMGDTFQLLLGNKNMVELN